MNIIDKAAIFAATAHAGQRREHTGELYIAHCIEVQTIVMQAGGTDEMQAASLLHDVIEDCGVERGELADEFGHNVAAMVMSLSDLETGNRATRKRLSCERLAAASGEVQTIKLADLISNSRSIIERDSDFARVYLKEKVALLRAMNKGDQRLWDMAAKLIPDEYWS